MLRVFPVLCLLAVGCGGSSPVALVEGSVRFRGDALRGGTVVFTPDPTRGGSGPQSWAVVDDHGRFQLHADGRAGAAVGWHRITVLGTDALRLPAKYGDPELSGRHFEVRSDRPNVCTIDLD